jgi:hypothetical protein
MNCSVVEECQLQHLYGSSELKQDYFFRLAVVAPACIATILLVIHVAAVLLARRCKLDQALRPLVRGAIQLAIGVLVFWRAAIIDVLYMKLESGDWRRGLAFEFNARLKQVGQWACFRLKEDRCDRATGLADSQFCRNICYRIHSPSLTLWLASAGSAYIVCHALGVGILWLTACKPRSNVILGCFAVCASALVLVLAMVDLLVSNLLIQNGADCLLLLLIGMLLVDGILFGKEDSDSAKMLELAEEQVTISAPQNQRNTSGAPAADCSQRGGVRAGGSGGEVALKDSPEYKKYFDMLKMGLPKGAAQQKMVKDGKDPSILDLDPDQPLPRALRSKGGGGRGGDGGGGGGLLAEIAAGGNLKKVDTTGREQRSTSGASGGGGGGLLAELQGGVKLKSADTRTRAQTAPASTKPGGGNMLSQIQGVKLKSGAGRENRAQSAMSAAPVGGLQSQIKGVQLKRSHVERTASGRPIRKKTGGAGNAVATVKLRKVNRPSTASRTVV